MDEGQAPAALLSTPRLWATSTRIGQVRFSVLEIVTLRASGPARWGKGRPTWRRFEIAIIADPSAGRWDSEYANATFCLHVKAARPQTVYPFGGWSLTGFDNLLAVWSTRMAYGCKDTPEARKQVGGPYR